MLAIVRKSVTPKAILPGIADHGTMKPIDDINTMAIAGE